MSIDGTSLYFCLLDQETSQKEQRRWKNLHITRAASATTIN
uniref:Uncharacterized protein n=1 Tax=Arundo donax TaxID=35708 RepID=A0A0A9HT64_ARUDO